MFNILLCSDLLVILTNSGWKSQFIKQMWHTKLLICKQLTWKVPVTRFLFVWRQITCHCPFWNAIVYGTTSIIVTVLIVCIFIISIHNDCYCLTGLNQPPWIATCLLVGWGSGDVLLQSLSLVAQFQSLILGTLFVTVFLHYLTLLQSPTNSMTFKWDWYKLESYWFQSSSTIFQNATLAKRHFETMPEVIFSGHCAMTWQGITSLFGMRGKS